jgi:phosphonate transport system substrate-binding protein
MKLLPLPLLSCALLCAVPGHAEEKPYVIGLAPTIAESISVPEGRILSKYLSVAVKHKVESRVFKSYDELTDALEKGDVDLGWINPYEFVKASEQSKIIPIAKAMRGGESYRAVFFVRADSKVQNLADMKGLKVAWVDRSSSAGYLFPQSMMIRQHLLPATHFGSEIFVGSHKAVCEAVLSGAADVGATFHTGDDPTDFRPDGCRVSLGTAVLEKVRGITSSDPIPTEVIAARPTINRVLALKLGSAFASMSDTSTGRQVLSAVFHADGFGSPLDSDFDSVRAAAQALESVASGGLAAQAADPNDKAAPKTIHFGTNNVEILTESFPLLDRLSSALKDDPKLQVQIAGHSDSVKNGKYNMMLSQRRADAVRNYLINAGVAAYRVEAQGLGSAKPVATNDTEWGRAANRRVEIRIIDAIAPDATDKGAKPESSAK